MLFSNHYKWFEHYAHNQFVDTPLFKYQENKHQEFMRILFWLFKAKINKNNKAPIYVRVTINGEREQFSTGCYIKPELWDHDKQRCKGRDIASKSKNNELSSIKKKLEKVYGEACLASDNVSAQAVLNYYLDKQEEHYIGSVYLKHNDRIKLLIGKEYVTASYNRYKREREHLLEFMKSTYSKKDIRLNELKETFVEDYTLFLKTVKGHKANHVFKVIQRLKKVVKWSVRNGWLQKDPFAEVKIKQSKVELVYLTEDELLRLERKEIKVKRLSLIRDLFLFQCYSGLAFRELELLTHKQILVGSDNELWIICTRQKTLRPFKVPLLPKAKKLVDKYYEKGRDVVFPVMSNEIYNFYLKALADLCNIDKRLTSHVGRKTFATTITLLNGVPLETVSSMLGHASVLTTQASYAQVLDEKISRDMQKLRNKE